MKLEIGTKITWTSAAGTLNGTITNIILAPSASGAVTPWIDVRPETRASSVRICALDSYLKQLKVVLFKDNRVERVNLMTGKKYLEDADTPLFMSPSSETYWSM